MLIGDTIQQVLMYGESKSGGLTELWMNLYPVGFYHYVMART